MLKGYGGLVVFFVLCIFLHRVMIYIFLNHVPSISLSLSVLHIILQKQIIQCGIMFNQY